MFTVWIRLTYTVPSAQNDRIRVFQFPPKTSHCDDDKPEPTKHPSSTYQHGLRHSHYLWCQSAFQASTETIHLSQGTPQTPRTKQTFRRRWYESPRFPRETVGYGNLLLGFRAFALNNPETKHYCNNSIFRRLIELKNPLVIYNAFRPVPTGLPGSGDKFDR